MPRALQSSLRTDQGGSSILGSDKQSQLGGLLGEATKTVSGLDKKGPPPELAAAASSKQLGGIVSLVSSAL